MSEARPLEGTVALVTGAAQGIGRATALRLAADGATVAANDREPSERLDEVARACGGVPAIGDVSDPAAVEEMVAGVENDAGSIGLLVANAAYMSMGPFLEHEEADWWRQVETNLSGTFYLVRSVLPGMRRIGGGRIVIVSSEWGVTGWPNATAYAASKAGLISFGKTLGRELAPENIVTNVISPGIVDTPQLEVDAHDAGVTREEIKARYAAGIPVGRIGRPEDIASTVAFLARAGSAALVGQVLQPNGGTTRGGAS
ncbi:MAG: SDR family oxidoreductase [Actinomycetota bacterium]|nr:SDR family oxidoreductase [Actinomycetota bacterium]